MRSQLSSTSGEQRCTTPSNRLRWIAEEMLEAARRLVAGAQKDLEGLDTGDTMLNTHLGAESGTESGVDLSVEVIPFVDNCYRMALEAAATWLFTKKKVTTSVGFSAGCVGLPERRSRDLLLFYLEICGIESSAVVKDSYLDGIGHSKKVSAVEQCCGLEAFVQSILQVG